MRLVFIPLPLLFIIAVTACGQSVPTCDDACSAVGAPPAGTVYTTNPAATVDGRADCAKLCDGDERHAVAVGLGGDFQALLTCVGNANAFAAACAPLACGLTETLGTPTGCGDASSGH